MARPRVLFVLAAALVLTWARASGAPPPAARLPTLHNETVPSVRVYPPAPPVPSALTSTTDVQVCTRHGGFGGGLACKALLPTGSLALVWGWNGSSKIDGFHVWRIDGGRRVLVGTQPHFQSDPAVYSLYIVDAVPPDGFGGKCYAVTAFGSLFANTLAGAGMSQDSPLSPEYCPSSNAVVQTQVFTQPQWFSVSKTSDVSIYTAEYDSGSFSVSASETTNTIKNGLVANHGPAAGNLATNALARTAILFDLSSLSNRQIRSARLRLTVDDSIVNSTDSPNPATNHYTSCVDKIGTAMDSGWQSYRDWIDASIVSTSIQQQGPDVAFDVTSIVSQWTQGERNYGFVLFGGADSNSGETSPQDTDWIGVSTDFTQTYCLTVYRPDNIELEVQYQ